MNFLICVAISIIIGCLIPVNKTELNDLESGIYLDEFCTPNMTPEV